MLYLYIKAIHIIFVVCWMAGLFYIVRIFIYHIEAREREEDVQKILFPQFALMASRLWNIITVPAMILTVLAGIAMLYLNPYLFQADWMLVKLGFVVGLLIYHFVCQHVMIQLRNGIFSWTSTQLRIWNEVATILLVAIVFVVVLKNALNWIYGIIGLFLFIFIIMMGVKIYKYYRLKK
ncbi:putative membrane protein [Arcticibacter tournemirensis]|uniref:Protoporphyrinogen IX oxidase n=1 Tax=Arcticibacter tournemirensis TaxID=699437 RepID=A0A5M9H5P0_9SPHI|nr:CopD family protein [Arcticibacter tournemirensis]TQM52396.1 putative membrane protein [Arcticibacter tournemirensis]